MFQEEKEEMRGMRRAQSSIEFLAVTAIGLLLVVGVSMVLLNQSSSSKDVAVAQQAQQLGTTILSQAGTVYALGANSWVTIDANIPKGLTGIYTVENRTLVFELQTQAGPVATPVFSSIPITGLYQISDRNSIVNGSLQPGSSKIKVLSNGTNVIISLQ